MTLASASVVRKEPTPVADGPARDAEPRHLSYQEIADLKLPGLPTSAFRVRLRFQHEGWCRFGRRRQHNGGGPEYSVEVLREILPPPAAAALRWLMAPAAPVLVGMTEGVAALPVPAPARGLVAKMKAPAAGLPVATRLKDWQRKVATARAGVLHELELMAEEIGIEAARERLVAQSRAGELPEPLAEQVRVANRARGHLSITSLKRWAKRREGGFAALAPDDRERGERVKPWGEMFLKIYGRPQKPAFAAAVEELHAVMPDGMSKPSVSQVRRWHRKVSAVDRERGRRGPNALKAVRAFVRRDTAEMCPGDVYVCDGHTFDAEVAHPRHGQPFRPELTCVIDWKTRQIVGWSAALAESTWAVADALRHAVESHGIPAVYYADHGPGQENRTLCAMLARLGIREERSLPRNSQARGVIERFNQSLIAAAKRLPTYMGQDMDKDAANRVFKVSRREIRLIGTSRLMLPWDEFLTFVGEAIEEYNNRAHRALPKLRDPETGRMRHMSPAEAWLAAREGGWEPIIVSEGESDDLFRPWEIRKTHRGEVALHNKRYFARDLEHLNGDEVMVFYDIHDPSRVWVRDLDERLVAIAELDANSRPAFPKSVIEQAREDRVRRKLKRLESEAAKGRAELEGPKPTIDCDAGWTPEQQAKIQTLVARQTDREPPRRREDEDKDLWYARARRLDAAKAAGRDVSEADLAWLEKAHATAWYQSRRRMDQLREKSA